MKLYKDEKVLEKRRTTEAYKCDRCGKIAKKEDTPFEYQEYLNIFFCGGYDSIFGDMDSFECDLCQHCVKDVLGKYLRNVTISYGDSHEHSN